MQFYYCACVPFTQGSHGSYPPPYATAYSRERENRMGEGLRAHHRKRYIPDASIKMRTRKGECANGLRTLARWWGLRDWKSLYKLHQRTLPLDRQYSFSANSKQPPAHLGQHTSRGSLWHIFYPFDLV